MREGVSCPTRSNLRCGGVAMEFKAINIKFCINRDELCDALVYLAPFIRPQKKKDFEKDSDDESISIPEIYYDDKVSFSFGENHMALYVIVDEIKIERTINEVPICYGPGFCLPFAYLQQELEEHVCERLRFEEDRFFGFMVYDDKTNEYLFDINAFSIRKQTKISSPYHELPVYHLITLEQSILTELLKDFDKYTHSGHTQAFQYIWCQIKDGCCTVFATDGSSLRLKHYPTEIVGQHSFSFPGRYAARILNIISQWQNQFPLRIEFDDKWCRIYKNGYRDIIDFAMHLESIPNIQKALNVNTNTHKATLKTDSLRSTFKMIKAMEGSNRKILLHFLGNHVNIYWKDPIWNRSVFEFKDVEEYDGYYAICLDVKIFEKIIDEITSDSVSLYLVGDNIVHIVAEDEELLGDIIRVQARIKLDEKDQELLNEGDEALENDQRYLEKYYSKKEDDVEDD